MKKHWLGVFAALGMVSVACSSSTNNGTVITTDAATSDTPAPGTDAPKPTDSGGKTDTGTPKPVDGSTADAPAVETDKTTGKECADDTVCDQTGAGINKCSNKLFTIGTIYPTPVCVGTDCDPGDGTTIVGCDNDLGVCLDTGSGGICLPVCTFDDSGAAPAGCVGKDICNVYGWGSDTSTPPKVSGVGYCFGGCKADADCTGGDKCQIESGLCAKAPVKYTKKLGDTCTDADTKTGCECLYTTSTKKGYCSTACVVGGAACAAGFTCSSGLPKLDSAGKALFTKEPVGMAGNCLKNCTTNADCTALNGYCDDTVAGKVCQPGTAP